MVCRERAGDGHEVRRRRGKGGVGRKWGGMGKVNKGGKRGRDFYERNYEKVL